MLTLRSIDYFIHSPKSPQPNCSIAADRDFELVVKHIRVRLDEQKKDSPERHLCATVRARDALDLEFNNV